MTKKAVKVITLMISAFILATLICACKKENKGTSSIAGMSTVTSKASPSASAKQTGSTQVKTTGTTTTKLDGGTGSDNDVILQNSSNKEQPGDVTVTGQDTVSESQASNEIAAERKIDFKGGKITIASRDASPLTEPSPDAPEAEFIKYRSWLNAQKKYNFTLEWKRVSGSTGDFANAFINSTMAGVHFADVINASSKQAFPTMVEKGYIQPIDQYVDFNDPVYNYNFTKQAALWKGKHYGIGQLPAISGHGIFFNRDIFAKEGIPDPQDYVDNNNWNWDSFLNLAQQTTKDFNGDGVVDQWGIVMAGYAQSGDTFIFSNGADYTYIRQDGRVEFGLNDPRAVKALQFMSDLANTYKVMTYGIDFKQGNSAMVVGYQLWQGKGNFYNVEGLNYGFVPLPKGPDVTDYVQMVDSSNFLAYPITLKNPQDIVPVINDILTIWDPSKPEHISLDKLARDTISTYVRTDRDIDIAMKYARDPGFSPYKSFNDVWSLMSNSVFQRIIKLETTPQAALNETTAQAQAMIDAACGQ